MVSLPLQERGAEEGFLISLLGPLPWWLQVEAAKVVDQPGLQALKGEGESLMVLGVKLEPLLEVVFLSVKDAQQGGLG